jgi:hypothetical protein
MAIVPLYGVWGTVLTGQAEQGRALDVNYICSATKLVQHEKIYLVYTIRDAVHVENIVGIVVLRR